MAQLDSAKTGRVTIRHKTAHLTFSTENLQMKRESQKTCFSIMPFDSSFDDISSIIAESARKCGLKYVRGDHRNQPGSIMPQILDDIRRAAVIVADVSGHNPNVFYELGVAHQVKGPDQVVIITQSTDGAPFDVTAFRHLRYDHSKSGRRELGEKLPQCLKESLKSSTDREVWSVIRGPLERTRLIVRDLKLLSANGSRRALSGTIIRMVSGLGSLAISSREPPDLELGRDYNNALIEERDALRAALARGAKLRALLHPPRRFTHRMLEERLQVRYQRLIGLLEGRSDITADKSQAREDLKAMAHTTIRLTPVPMPHLLVIGNKVAYEGMKRGGSRGYAMTHCETDRQAVEGLADHFKECDAGTRHLQSAHLAEQLTAFLREARQSK
jgi:hypothetical protein